MAEIESIEIYPPDYVQMATFRMETQVQYASDGEFHLRREIFIDMDQTVELNYLLTLVNHSSSQYNFSEATALSLIREYMSKMYTLNNPITIVLICLYIPVFLLSLGGNGLVIFVVFKNPHMRRVKNLFLVNLALADLLVTIICMPMVVGQIVFRLWVYGDVMCKLTGYMQGVAVTSSIFTLTALSIDRYLAIKAPLSLRRISGKSQAARFLLVIWLLSALFVGPVLYVRNVQEIDFERFHISMRYCVELWPNNIDRQAYSIFLMIITYAVPIMIIATCYSMIGRTLCSDEFHRKTSDSSSTVMLGRKRVARMLIALIAVFIFCWLPYNSCSLSLDVNVDYVDTQFLPFTLWVGHAHSAINPILYWFLNKSFRHCMRKALMCQPLKKSSKDTPSPQPCGDIGDLFHIEVFHAGNSPPSPGERGPTPGGAGDQHGMIRLTPGSPSSGTSSHSGSRNSCSAERRRVVHVTFSPPTSSSHLMTTTSGPQDSHTSVLSLVVHCEERGSQSSISSTSFASHSELENAGDFL